MLKSEKEKNSNPAEAGEYSPDLKDNDVDRILKDNDWKKVTDESYADKKNIIVFEDCNNERGVLKIGRIPEGQISLMKIANQLPDLCFKTPEVFKQRGINWFAMEYVKGELVEDLYEQKTEDIIKKVWNISQDYQKVINQYLSEQGNTIKIAEEAQKWFDSRLSLWGTPFCNSIFNAVAEERLGKEYKIFRDRELVELQRRFKNLDIPNDEKYGLYHGDIVGQNMILKGEDYYLIDHNLKPRPTKYYDWLRFMDHLFEVHSDGEKIMRLTEAYIEEFIPEKDREIVNLLRVQRLIGVFGWDWAFHQVPWFKGREKEDRKILEDKIVSAANFIKRVLG